MSLCCMRLTVNYQRLTKLCLALMIERIPNLGILKVKVKLKSCLNLLDSPSRFGGRIMTYKAAASRHNEIEPAFGATTQPVRITAFAAFQMMLADLQLDIDRYNYMQQSNWLRSLLGRQGLWVMTQYRLSRWVHFHVHIPGLRFGLKLLCAIGQKMIEILTGVELPNRAEIGGGVFMPHANGIVIHIDAKIGTNCNISQQVTIGVGGTDPSGTPVIGDRVFLGPGAKVFGPITVGDDVAIGANAVVIKDIPSHAVTVGIPAKVIITDQGMLMVGQG
jgi:serine O-acetyltransferase